MRQTHEKSKITAGERQSTLNIFHTIIQNFRTSFEHKIFKFYVAIVDQISGRFLERPFLLLLNITYSFLNSYSSPSLPQSESSAPNHNLTLK